MTQPKKPGRNVMTPRPTLIKVTLGLAVIAALALVAPALGGPSLKKLVKKEVAKQISKATGPAGPPGNTGPQGVPGPTAAGVGDRPDPVANPDDFAGSPEATVNAPTSGRLLATWYPDADGGVSVTCTVGNPTIGLYVDGLPVPDTQASLVSGVQRHVSLAGIIPVAPGDHLVQLGQDCPDGNIMSAQRSNMGMVGLLLGG
jgi:hypothetical protein